MESPNFIRRIARVEIMAESHISKATTQFFKYRLTIPLKMRLMMTPFNIPRRKMMILLKSQTLHPLGRITTVRTRNDDRRFNCSKTSSIDLSGSNRSLQFSINLNTQVKVNLMAYWFYDTSVSSIGKVLFKFCVPPERPPWLYFMVTSPTNPLQLGLLQMTFIYQTVLLFIIWTSPHCYMKMKITCSQQQSHLVLA